MFEKVKEATKRFKLLAVIFVIIVLMITGIIAVTAIIKSHSENVDALICEETTIVAESTDMYAETTQVESTTAQTTTQKKERNTVTTTAVSTVNTKETTSVTSIKETDSVCMNNEHHNENDDYKVRDDNNNRMPENTKAAQTSTSENSTSTSSTTQTVTETTITDVSEIAETVSSEVESTAIEETEPVEAATEPFEWDGPVLTRNAGTVQGPSGKETYYNLNMSGVVDRMHRLGFEGEYWVREDGCKMFGDYIMVAANLDIRPRGTILPTSLGWGIVADTGGFAKRNQTQLDIAVNW